MSNKLERLEQECKGLAEILGRTPDFAGVRSEVEEYIVDKSDLQSIADRILALADERDALKVALGETARAAMNAYDYMNRPMSEDDVETFGTIGGILKQICDIAREARGEKSPVTVESMRGILKEKP